MRVSDSEPAVTVSVRVLEGDGCDRDAEREEDSVGQVTECETVFRDRDKVTDSDLDSDGDCESVSETVRESDSDFESDSDADGECVVDADGVSLLNVPWLSENETVAEADVLELRLGVLRERVELGVRSLLVTDTDPDKEGVRELDP